MGEQLTTDEWRAAYDRESKNPPQAGDYLRTHDRSPIRVEIILNSGQDPFVLSRVYLRGVVGEEPGWFCRKMDDESTMGWKCIFLPKARSEVIRRLGLRSLIVGVKTLRIVKPSNSEGSFLVEVAEW